MATPAAPEDFQIHRILLLKGPLNLRTLFKFQEAMRSESSPVLIVDFTGVPYVDSAGLGAIVAAYVSGLRSNRKILFAGFTDEVRTLIEMTHLTKLLGNYKTLQDAEADL